MAFEHVASGTGTDQDLLDLARAKLARVLSGVTEYTDANGNRVKITESEGQLLNTVQKLTVLVGAASGPADNLVELRRAP